MYMQVGDFCVSKGSSTVPLMQILRKGTSNNDVRWFSMIFDLPTYLTTYLPTMSDNFYFITSNFWESFWTYLPTLKLDVINGRSLTRFFQVPSNINSNSGQSMVKKNQIRSCGLTSSLVSLVIPRVQFVAYPPLCSDRSYGHHHCALVVHHNGVLMSKFVSDLDSYCF